MFHLQFSLVFAWQTDLCATCTQAPSTSEYTTVCVCECVFIFIFSMLGAEIQKMPWSMLNNYNWNTLMIVLYCIYFGYLSLHIIAHHAPFPATTVMVFFTQCADCVLQHGTFQRNAMPSLMWFRTKKHRDSYCFPKYWLLTLLECFKMFQMALGIDWSRPEDLDCHSVEATLQANTYSGSGSNQEHSKMYISNQLL